MFLKRPFICLLLIAILLAGCASSNVTTQPQQVTQAQPTLAQPTQVEVEATLAPAAEVSVTSEPTESAETEGGSDDFAGAPQGDLVLTGQLLKQIGWTTAELKAMPAASAQGKNNKGDVSSYSGVLIADLLKLGAPLPAAKTLVFSGDGGIQVEVPLADVLSCTDCILTFRSQGGLSLLLPFYSEQLAIKGVIGIEVK